MKRLYFTSWSTLSQVAKREKQLNDLDEVRTRENEAKEREIIEAKVFLQMQQKQAILKAANVISEKIPEMETIQLQLYFHAWRTSARLS